MKKDIKSQIILQLMDLVINIKHIRLYSVTLCVQSFIFLGPLVEVNDFHFEYAPKHEHRDTASL